MIFLHPVTLAHWPLQRTLRLAALQDTPTAFGSTYAREIAFADDEWQRRTVAMEESKTITGVLALTETGEGAGLAGGVLAQDDSSIAHLFSMWVAPPFRKAGVGAKIVEHIVAWAASRHCREIRLAVTCNNAPAVRFYERLGFVPTGHTEQHRAYPELHLIEMARPLTAPVPPATAVPSKT